MFAIVMLSELKVNLDWETMRAFIIICMFSCLDRDHLIVHSRTHMAIGTLLRALVIFRQRPACTDSVIHDYSNSPTTSDEAGTAGLHRS